MRNKVCDFFFNFGGIIVANNDVYIDTPPIKHGSHNSSYNFHNSQIISWDMMSKPLTFILFIIVKLSIEIEI